MKEISLHSEGKTEVFSIRALDINQASAVAMKPGWKRFMPELARLITTLIIIAFLCDASAFGQAPSGQQMAEQAFKNVTVLKGIPVDEFMDTMGMFSAALTLTCSACHVQQSLESWDKYADDTPLKQTARRMVLMVNALNRNNNFRAGRKVTCWTCHHGSQLPEFIPNLSVQYQTPVDDPNTVFDVPGRQTDPKTPSADQIFDKYIQALGGAQKVSALNTFVAKGTYEGYDTEHEMVPVEIYGRSPNQLTTVVHLKFEGRNDANTKTFDGTNGWVASPDKPVGLMQLTGGNLEGARIDAIASFPARLRQLFTQWQVSTTAIDDRDVYILQGSETGKLPVKLYFDQESGLLVRLLRYTDTIVGRVPTQIDFSDYRDVSGIKLPFHLTTTWTNGQTNVELSEWQVNVPVDLARFSRPAPVPVIRR
jgi:photosynthetic reaction center cytochrome c subunit